MGYLGVDLEMLLLTQKETIKYDLRYTVSVWS
jgi:hypothetical protein